MRFLLLFTHAGLFRNFETTLEELASRGHEVHVSFDSDRYPSEAFARLVERHPNVTQGFTPLPDGGRWLALGRQVRATSDYVRYLDPRYAHAPKLRHRARRQVPPHLRPLVASPARAAAADRRLRAIEASLPVDGSARAFLQERAPDVLVISPLFGSPTQLECLRAARRMGIPVCLSVASWDNLTNKGLIREIPDVVAVWNSAQRREALELHNVPADRVVVTGAQNFDEWFARSASSSREEFLGRLGLPVDGPLLLYLGSSSFIAPDEASFAARWLAALRASPDEKLREASVLFRPHPQNARQWERPELLDDPRCAIYPPPASTPQATGRADWSRADFYDSMRHAAAAVGVNTTAMIETGILGKGIYTVLDPQFSETQGGTLHFAHLTSVNGGLLHVAEGLEEHLDQLREGLAVSGPDERSLRFVEAFVRPHGLDRPASPVVVDAYEKVRHQADTAPEQVLTRPALAALSVMAAAADRTAGRGKRSKRKKGRRRRRAVKRLRALAAGR